MTPIRELTELELDHVAGGGSHHKSGTINNQINAGVAFGNVQIAQSLVNDSDVIGINVEEINF